MSSKGVNKTTLKLEKQKQRPQQQQKNNNNNNNNNNNHNCEFFFGKTHLWNHFMAKWRAWPQLQPKRPG